MEFIQNIFGGKRKKQERIMRKLEIAGQYHKDDFVGPDYLRGDTVDVQPENFLNIIEEKGIKKVTAEAGRGSDTHTPYELFAEVDKKLELYVKAKASTPLWHVPPNPNEFQTFFPKLEEMGFKRDSELSKEKWSVFVKTPTS